MIPAKIRWFLGSALIGVGLLWMVMVARLWGISDSMIFPGLIILAMGVAILNLERHRAFVMRSEPKWPQSFFQWILAMSTITYIACLVIIVFMLVVARGCR
jgi:hypothetical protein